MQIVEYICAAERRTTKRSGGRCIESAWICVTMGRWIFLGDILPPSEGRETKRKREKKREREMEAPCYPTNEREVP